MVKPSLQQLKLILHRLDPRISLFVVLFKNNRDPDGLGGIFVLAVEHYTQAACGAWRENAAWKIHFGAFAGIHDVDLDIRAGGIGEFKKRGARFSFFDRTEIDQFFVPGDKRTGCFSCRNRSGSDDLHRLGGMAGEEGEKGEDGNDKSHNQVILVGVVART